MRTYPDPSTFRRNVTLLVAVALWLLPAFDERVAVRDALRPGRKAHSA